MKKVPSDFYIDLKNVKKIGVISCLYNLTTRYIIVLFSELNPDQVKELDLNSVRNITMQDFRDSLKRIRRSVSPASLAAYEKWNFDYGDVSL